MTQDHERSIEKYRRHAADYDASARFTQPIRLRTVARLALAPGECVLDAGCGTGLSLPLLVAGVGSGGRVIGVEQSPEMMALARERVRAAGWDNVTLVEAPLERASLPGTIDAVLFNYAHDILQSEAALDAVFERLRPGAKIAIAGVKYHPWWLAPLNLHVWLTMRRYNANPRNLATPWSLVERRVTRLERVSTLLGRGYIAWGRTPERGAG